MAQFPARCPRCTSKRKKRKVALGKRIWRCRDCGQLFRVHRTHSKSYRKDVRRRIERLKAERFRDDPHCVDCGKPVDDDTGYLTYVVPRSQGGGATPENMILVCQDCGANHRDPNKVRESFPIPEPS